MMNKAHKIKLSKMISFVLIALLFVSLSSFSQTKFLSDDFRIPSQSDNQPTSSSLSPLCKNMAFCRDTTFEALLKQELDTAKVSFFIKGVCLTAFLFLIFFLTLRYIHRTQILRLLI